jgi:hypothetical protein
MRSKTSRLEILLVDDCLEVIAKVYDDQSPQAYSFSA